MSGLSGVGLNPGGETATSDRLYMDDEEAKSAIHAQTHAQLPGIESGVFSEGLRDIEPVSESYSASGDDSLPNLMRPQHSRSNKSNPGTNLEDQSKTASNLDDVLARAHQLLNKSSNASEKTDENAVDRIHRELQKEKSQPNSDVAKQVPSGPGVYDTWVRKGLESLKRDHGQTKLEQSLRLTAAPHNFQLSSRVRPELDRSALPKKPEPKEPEPKEPLPKEPAPKEPAPASAASAPVPEPSSKKVLSQSLELPIKIQSPFQSPRNPVRAITEQLEGLRLHLSSDYPNSGSVLPSTPELALDPMFKINSLRTDPEAAFDVDTEGVTVAESVSNASLDTEPPPEFVVHSAHSTSEPTSGLGFDTIATTLPDLTKFNASIVDPETDDPDTIVEPESVEPETVEPETVNPETIDPETIDPESVDPEIAATDSSLPSDDSASPVQEENLDEVVSVQKTRKAVTGMYGPEADALTNNEETPSRGNVNGGTSNKSGRNANDADGDNDADASTDTGADTPSPHRRESRRSPTHSSKRSHRRRHNRDYHGRHHRHHRHRHQTRHDERRRAEQIDQKPVDSDSLHMMQLQQQQQQQQLVQVQEYQRQLAEQQHQLAEQQRLDTQQQQLATQQQQLSTQQQNMAALRAELGRSQQALTEQRQQQQHAQQLLDHRESELRLQEKELALRAVDVETQAQTHSQEHQDIAALRGELGRSQQALTDQRQQQQHAQRLLNHRESELRLQEEQLALRAASLVDVEPQPNSQTHSLQHQDMAALRAELGRSQQALTEQRQQQQHAQRLLDHRESELRFKEEQLALLAVSPVVPTQSQAQPQPSPLIPHVSAGHSHPSQQVPDRGEVSAPANKVKPEAGDGERAPKAKARAAATPEAKAKVSTEPPALPDTPQELLDCMVRQMKKHAMTASSLFKIMDSKRTNRVSQRQFALGLENIGIYSGRATLWTREGGATPAKGSKRNMSAKKTKKKTRLSWTLTLSRAHMASLFEIFDYNSERNISWKVLQKVLSQKSKKPSPKPSPDSTAETSTEANNAASKPTNNVVAAVAPPANQLQSYTVPAPNASLAPFQPHAALSQHSTAPTPNIFPNTILPGSAPLPNPWYRPQTAPPSQAPSLSTSVPVPSRWTAPRPSTAAYMPAPVTDFGTSRSVTNFAGTWPQRLRHAVASASPPHEPLSTDFFSRPRSAHRSDNRRRSDQPRSRHRRSNRQPRAHVARGPHRPRADLTLVANAPLGPVPAPLRLRLHSLLAGAESGPMPLLPVWRGQKPSDVLDLRFMASGRFRFCVSARVSVDLAHRSANPNSTNVAVAVEMAKELTRRGWMWERKDRDSADLRWCGSAEAIQLSQDPNPGFGPRVPPYQMINHFPHMATVCRRPCLWYEPSVRLHAKLQFALAHWLHTMSLSQTSHHLSPGAAGASSLVATKQKAVVASAMALMSTPKADASALILDFTGLSRAWVVERPDKLELHLSDACANADAGWHVLQLSDWLSEYAMRALAVPLLEMVWARVDRDVMLMVAAPVQAALALLRAGEVRCHSRQQWAAARILLDYGWTADELMRQAELCVSGAMTHRIGLPPAAELETRRHDLAVTVQKLRECGTDSPVWCVKINSQDGFEHDKKSNPFDSDSMVGKRLPDQGVTVTFESLTGLLSALRDSAAPRLVLQRFPPIKSLLQAEHGLVVVRQWVVVLSLQPLVVVGYKHILPYTCRPHPHGEGMRLVVSPHAHGMLPQAEWRSLLHQQQQKYQRSAAVYLNEIQEQIRHVVVSHLRAHAAPGCFGAAAARHPDPGKSEVNFQLHQRQGSFQWMNFDFLVLAPPQPERVWLADVSLTPRHDEQPLGPRADQITAHAVSGISRLTGLLLDGLATQTDAGQVWRLWCNDKALSPPVNVRSSADLLQAHDFGSARDLRSELCDTLRPTWGLFED